MGTDLPDLETVMAGARARFGALGVDDETLRPLLAARLDQRAREAGVDRAAVLAVTCGEELCLALAWEAGVAWEHYHEHFEGLVRGAARKQGADEAQAAELAAGLPGALLATGTLRGYLGRGSLAGWLTVLVRRRVIDDLRRGAGHLALETALEAEIESAPADSSAEERETLERLVALVPALRADLTERERLVLLMKYEQGLPQRAIARAIGTSDSRVTRLVQHAQEKLGARLRSAFPEGEPAGWPGLHVLWRELGTSGEPGQIRDTPSRRAPGGTPTMNDAAKEHPPADALVGWVEGRLLPVEVERIEVHLAGCAACRALAAEWAPESSVESPPPSLFAPSRPAPRPAPRVGSRWTLAAAAAVLLALWIPFRLLDRGASARIDVQCAVAADSAELFGTARSGALDPAATEWFAGVAPETTCHVNLLADDGRDGVLPIPLDRQGRFEVELEGRRDYTFGPYPRTLPSGQEVRFVLFVVREGPLPAGWRDLVDTESWDDAEELAAILARELDAEVTVARVR